MQWFENSVFYHIYPLGYCGCEKENTDAPSEQGRILKIAEQAKDIAELGFTAVYLGPVFESESHGYDTIDYTKIDKRLGSNDDFKAVCKAFHDNGIKVVVDGVFNHVGRSFWAFKDVLQNKFSSRYRDWFCIKDGNNGYNDGFFYEGWEGHYELVKLNLHNPEVKEHIKSCITGWVNEFSIDGIRLDVAYCLDLQFLKELRGHCKWLKNDFWLMGETLHGDYNKWMNDEMLDSVTNYECYKGIYSSFNEMNMFEISYSINRQFGSENWCIYRGKKLYTFVDNHDVSRIATILHRKEHLFGAYTLLFTMPGIPSVYYLSEFAQSGDKASGDNALRIPYRKCPPTVLTEHISKLAKAHTLIPALHDGDYKQLFVTNKQYAFSRSCGESQAVILINADESAYTLNVNKSGLYTNILTGEKCDLSQDITLKPFESKVFISGTAELFSSTSSLDNSTEAPITIEAILPPEEATEKLTLSFTPTAMRQLKQKAADTGKSVEDYATELLTK